MVNLNNSFKGILKRKGLTEIVQKSSDRFTPKQFAEKYYSMYRSSYVIRYLLSIFSIVTGVFFFMTIASNFSLSIALALGVSLFIILEILKTKLVNVSLTEVLQKNFNIISLAVTPLALFLFVASVYCSIHGAESLYKEIDHSMTALEGEYKHKTDSINRSYQKQFEVLKTEKNEYLSSVSWQGKIDIHNAANKKVIANYENRVGELEASKTLALEQLNIAHENSVISVNKQGQFEVEVWLMISLIIEAFILLCLFFQSYYEYITFIENSELYQEVKPLVTYPQNSSVGFQISGQVAGEKIKSNLSRNKEITGGKQDRKQDKYLALETCIRSGIQDMKILTKLGFNPAQVKQAINKFSS